jgi:dihydrodipicolinate synthase/N-acetylneuraminate lyase
LDAAVRAGRLDDAAGRQAALDAFIDARDGSFELSTFKALCALRGAPVGDVRSPLKRLPADRRADLGRLLR